MGGLKVHRARESELDTGKVQNHRQNQTLQLPQLEAVQPEHELPVPAIGTESPLLSLEKEEKREKTRLALCLHLGQGALRSALFKERSNSNLQAQSVHKYS